MYFHIRQLTLRKMDMWVIVMSLTPLMSLLVLLMSSKLLISSTLLIRWEKEAERLLIGSTLLIMYCF